MADMAAKPLAAAAIAQLESDGVATLIGTVVNPAGLIHAKTVPLRRMSSFADPGLGASPVWHVFAIDQAGIVFSESTGVVGDQRIRIDLGADGDSTLISEPSRSLLSLLSQAQLQAPQTQFIGVMCQRFT